ncbi:MAG: hypothetical protein NTW46_02310, partial [Candidatus Nealsonbacteria bacterium]|nr:hypothetical protein [Candidatus Nealsonbacteria bacterium]
MSGFKSQFSQFPRFIQQGGAVLTPNQVPTQMPPQQMPPQMPPPSQMAGTPFVPPKRKSPLKAILITLLIIIVLSGAGFAIVLGMRIWDPMWNPFRPKPQAVFDQAISKMNGIKKYGYKVAGSISLNATDSNSKNAKAQGSINSSGAIDITDILNPKFSSVLDFIFSLSDPDSGENMGMSSAGEIRSPDKTFYFKIGKFEATGTAIEDLKYYISSFEMIKDKWTKMTKDQISSWIGQSGDSFSEAKQKEMENNIKAILAKYPLWQISEQLQDEKIGDVNVYHYIIALNQGNFQKAFSEIIKLNNDSDYFLAMAEGIGATFFEKLGEIKADIWIGKKDVLVYKVDFRKTVDLKQVIGSVAGDLSINLNLELSDHNKPVEVQIPFEAKSFEEVFGPIMKIADAGAKNSRIQAYINVIASAAAIMLDSKKSYSGLSCKAKDVDALCGDIKEQSGEDAKVFGYYKKYCAYSKLIKLNDSDAQQYYCVDYNLSSIKTDIDPSLKGYCTGKTFECPKPSVSP